MVLYKLRGVGSLAVVLPLGNPNSGDFPHGNSLRDKWDTVAAETAKCKWTS